MTQHVARMGCLAVVIAVAIRGVVACSDGDASPVLSGDDASTHTHDHDSGGAWTDPGDAAPSAVAVSIRFAAKVGTEAFACGTTYPALGSASTPVEPRDLRFFVQDLRLLDATGHESAITLDSRAPWQTSGVALLDFEDATGKCANGNPERNDVVTGTVAPGTYSGISFSNGVPEEVNHVDPATETAPLSAGGMTWGWLLGHLFVKAEMTSTSTDGGIGLFHLGSVGCANVGDGGPDFTKGPTTPCAQQNRNRVVLPSFDAKTNVIVLDVKTIFASTDLSTTSQCHSGGPACPPLFESIGLDFDGGARMPSAPAYRVE